MKILKTNDFKKTLKKKNKKKIILSLRTKKESLLKCGVPYFFLNGLLLQKPSLFLKDEDFKREIRRFFFF